MNRQFCRLKEFSVVTSPSRLPSLKLNYLKTCDKRSFRFVSTNAKTKKENEYDLVVIGGGSGGLACAKEAVLYNRKVAVLDYVQPTYHGTEWGLGGTCVNVGCIPKKLYHQAALVGKTLKDSQSYGWNVPKNVENDWNILRSSIIGHIKSLNWGYRVQLKEKLVDYFNARGSFLTPNSILAKDKKGKETVLQANKVVIAVGGRPIIPETIPGAKEYAITSDDIFFLNKPPGKTLVVGGSYVALECSGFLTGLGYDTSVMVRSICLRGFDQEMAKHITDHMKTEGTRFLEKCTPSRIEKLENGQLKVTWKNSENEDNEDTFDTVLFAVGRQPTTSSLGLENAGLKDSDSTQGKLVTFNEQTKVSNIYAIGDVAHGVPELTPVAIKSGKLLARRLFAGGTAIMNYNKVATTVFTPLEYGCVGLSEEMAMEKFGIDGIEISHAYYQPLEFSVPQRDSSNCYVKVISERGSPRTILGMHMIGPNAGEVIQGFAVALNCGVTMDQLELTIGIHPTVAEEIVKLNITKRSGVNPVLSGC